MNKAKQQMHKAKRAGMSNLELLALKELAKKEAEKIEARMADRAFLYMLAVPLNVLVADYWPKSAKKKAPQFIADVLSLWESVQAGVVSDQELADLVKEYAGVTIEGVWKENHDG
ncbi:hypothetical protein [Bacillus infantis]|uniref:hypothetical protein n=1 Tax=Bacillus infantis TaxID=324767 RepID=UPI003CEDD78C